MPEVFEEDLEEAAAEALQLSNLLVQDSVFRRTIVKTKVFDGYIIDDSYIILC